MTIQERKEVTIVMKVRAVFKDPDYSEFTRTAVELGESLEAKGWELKHEHYSQGVQTFGFKRGQFHIDVLIEEED